MTCEEDGGGFQSQARADLFFEFGREVSEDSDRAREFSYPHVFRGSHEACDVALRLGIPVGDFELKVMGSAWTPWVRPAMAVSLNPRRAFEDFRRGCRSCAMTCEDWRMRRACAEMSTTSLEVSP
jgi:hypothetical protein